MKLEDSFPAQKMRLFHEELSREFFEKFGAFREDAVGDFHRLVWLGVLHGRSFRFATRPILHKKIDHFLPLLAGKRLDLLDDLPNGHRMTLPQTTPAFKLPYSIT